MSVLIAACLAFFAIYPNVVTSAAVKRELFIPACGFETDLCGYKQDTDDDFDWTKGNGNTPTSSTGPITDHTLMNSEGSYMYIEASGKESGSSANLKQLIQAISDNGVKNGRNCTFTFWYHMYGSSVGTLNIKASDTVKWTKSGDQGNDWLEGMFTFSVSTDVWFTIEGIRGPSYRSDIAIDDLEITCHIDECAIGFHSCHEHATCTNAVNGFVCECNAGFDGNGTYCSSTVEGAVSMCDFEYDLCGYIQDMNDDFDWTKRSGKTPTPATGPTTDHTQTSEEGSYMYIEVSSKAAGSKASLNKLVLADSNARDCTFTFWYHMFGAHIGTLNVMIDDTVKWTQSENQGDEWHQGFISFSFTTSDVWITIEGIRGVSYRGDIAIDDLELNCDDNDECASGTDNCHEQATCTDTKESFTCICRDGYMGDGISCTDANECVTGANNCHVHALCTNVPGSFTCVCNDGYEGDGVFCEGCSDDEFDCASTTGPGCIPNYWTCDRFDDCDNHSDEADQLCCPGAVWCDNVEDENECLLGSDNCHEHAICTDTPESFTCECKDGYTGDGISCTGCSDDEFDCASTTGPGCIPNHWTCDRFDDCDNHSDEADQLCCPGAVWCGCSDDEFDCASTSGPDCIPSHWTCDGIDDCDNYSDEENLLCCPGAFWCACSDNEFDCASTSGRSCIPSHWTCDGLVDCDNDSDEAELLCCPWCVEDNCYNQQCQNGATCINGNDGISCACASGWTGTFCDIDVDNCFNNQQCQNGATCINGNDGKTCACAPGWTGTFCGIDIDECSSSPCVNGQCQDGVNIHSCVCEPGWAGDYCQTDIDECLSSPCVNGRCMDDVNMYSCDCDPGWTGGHCQSDINECVPSPCHNGGFCIDGVNSFTCQCSSGWTGDRCQTELIPTVNDMVMCRFINMEFCGYKKATNDNFNWQWLDITHAMYFNFTNTGLVNWQAVLSKTIRVKNQGHTMRCHIHFRYSMFSRIKNRVRFPGRLTIGVFDGNILKTIWTRAEDHTFNTVTQMYGSYNRIASFTLNQESDIQIQFRATIEDYSGYGEIIIHEVGELCVPERNVELKPDLFDTGICGTRPSYSSEGRIVGGQNADHGEWPWQAALYTQHGMFDCGASLINREWAITAAHCIQERTTVVFGDISKNYKSPSRQVSTATAFCHPHYDRKDNDICLLRLDTPVRYTDYVRPICLSTKRSEGTAYLSGSCYSTGWGLLRSGGLTPDFLQELQTDITPCEFLDPANKELYDRLTNNMYCIIGNNLGNTCQGDSGGPHVCPNADGIWHLEGVTSFGPLICADQGTSVMARISPYLSWFYSTVKFYSKSSTNK